MPFGSSNLDVSLLSYDEWLRFFFGQRILAEEEYFGDAFCSDYIFFDASNPTKVVSYLQRLCAEFCTIGQKHSLPQLNQGIWAILGPDFELQQYLWQRSTPLSERIACIRSMLHPYADFVAGHSASVMENCFEMWWDMVLGSFWSQPGCARDYASLDSEGRSLLDAAFDTLCTILALSDERCQMYALHGLGHLQHADVALTVQRFIDSHREEFPAEGITWLEKCRDGTVM